MIFNEANTDDIDGFGKPVVHLEMLDENKNLLASGTGIIARLDQTAGESYLVTALHNLSGRKPDGVNLHSSPLAIPRMVRIHRHHAAIKEFPLYDDAARPCFFCHNSGAEVDVTILPLAFEVDDGPRADPSFFDPNEHGRTVRLHVGQMCYVVGFPKNFVHRHPDYQVLPFWTTGHIASEPRATIEDRPNFVIDAATAEGLSGAPVFVRNPSSGYNRLLGIYTGRYTEEMKVGGKSEIRATQLGVVVGIPVILEVLEHKGPLTFAR